MRARDIAALPPDERPPWYKPRERVYAGGAAEHWFSRNLALHERKLPKALRQFLKVRRKAQAAKRRAEEAKVGDTA